MQLEIIEVSRFLVIVIIFIIVIIVSKCVIKKFLTLLTDNWLLVSAFNVMPFYSILNELSKLIRMGLLIAKHSEPFPGKHF